MRHQPASRRIADADAVIESLCDQRDAITDRIQEVRADRDRLVSERIEGISDDMFLNDPERLLWLCREAYAHTGAHERIQMLTKPDVPELSVHGMDARDGYVDQCLPVLHLALTRGQDTSAVADAIRRWSERFALGRDTLIVDVVDQELAADGSWGVEYNPADGTATLRVSRWGNPTEKAAGSLGEVLRYVAEHVWYRDGEDR